MGKLALYRKYRPQIFDDLYGQGHIATTLKNSVIKQTFGHAYLFCGPRGTGKTSVARLLAKAVNCEHPKDGNPDNICQNCKLINDEKALDIIEIDAASHTQVDNIREIIVERAHFAPTNLKYKVYIIDEAHMLSKSSFNALLKTLEEPPAHVIFILATTEPSKIIPTIVSRCQRFDFRKINLTDMIKRLDFIAKEEKIEIENGVTEIIAMHSEGGFRDAISLLDQISSLKSDLITKTDLENTLGITDSSVVIDFLASLLEKDANKALEIISNATDDGFDESIFLKNTLELMRRLLIYKIRGENEAELSEKTLHEIKKTISETTLTEMVKATDTLISSANLYKYSAIPTLVLEVATIKICNQEIPETAKVETTAIKEPNSHATLPKEVKHVAKSESKQLSRDAKVQWQELLMEIKNRNNSIHAFLKVCEPEFTDDTLLLHFPYKFHKERIEDAKNRQIVETAIKKVFGTQLRVQCSLKPLMAHEIHLEKPKKDDLLEEALDILGGEVIE